MHNCIILLCCLFCPIDDVLANETQRNGGDILLEDKFTVSIGI